MSSWIDYIMFHCLLREALWAGPRVDCYLRVVPHILVIGVLVIKGRRRPTHSPRALHIASDLTQNQLIESDLAQSALRQSDLTQSEFMESDLTQSELTQSEFKQSDLIESDLTTSDLRECHHTK